jgi:hypothetical protein
MRANVFLAFTLFLAVSASQEVPKSPAQAQCSFSDGSKITVTYSFGLKGYRFVTDGSLLAVKGVHVPAGDYAVSPAKDASDNWTFTMKKTIMKKGSWELPPLPMSVATPSPISGFPVFFDHTGGSCVMYWKDKKSDVVLSLEFTKENADLQVLN